MEDLDSDYRNGGGEKQIAQGLRGDMTRLTDGLDEEE